MSSNQQFHVKLNYRFNNIALYKFLILIALVITPFLLNSCDEKTNSSEINEIEVTTPASFLFVQQAGSGTFEPMVGGDDLYLLTLYEIEPLTTWFTDRPLRKSGTMPTGKLFSVFLTGEIFPNAALEIPNSGDKSEVVVFTILDSDYDEQNAILKYQVFIITGDTTDITPGYLSANVSFDPNTDKEIADDIFPSQFGFSSLFIDNLSTGDTGTDMCTNSIPIGPLDTLEVYDYGGGIQTYDRCCAQNPPDDCISNLPPICRPASPPDSTQGCKDVNGNQLYCGPNHPCPVATDFCNKNLGNFYCCTWEETG